MDRNRGQHDVQAVERIRAIAPKQKINGDLPIFHQRFHPCPSDAPSWSACDELLSQNRFLSALASTVERLTRPNTPIGTRVRRARDRFFAHRVLSQN